MATVVPVDDPADQRVSDFVGLKDRQARRGSGTRSGGDHGFFIAESAVVVRRLLRSPYHLRSLLVSDNGLVGLGADLDLTDAPVYVATPAVVAEVCGFAFHRGVMASADRRPLPELATLVAGVDLIVITEGVNDSENLGALFRNAAAFGAGAVVLDPTSADPLYRRSIRVSAGHVLAVPFTRVTDWPASIGALQGLGFEVLALTPAPEGSGSLDSVQRRPRQALLVGAEGAGLSEQALAAADRRVRIPLIAGVDSLNVATAVAIALHELGPAR